MNQLTAEHHCGLAGRKGDAGCHKIAGMLYFMVFEGCLQREYIRIRTADTEMAKWNSKLQKIDFGDHQKIYLFLLFSAYFVINLILLTCHEPWRDEAQVWLLARDVPVWKLPSQMAFEGNPCLWHLLVVPFAKLGIPYFVQNIMSYLVVMAAAFLLVYRSDFSYGVKALLLCSPFLMYYYAVIAGSYCLIPFLLFLLADWFPTRKEKPVRYMIVTALLMQTHTIMFVTSLLIMLCYLAETVADRMAGRDAGNYVKRALCTLLPVVSGVLLFCQLMNGDGERWLRVRTADPYHTVRKMLEKYGESVEKLCGLFPVIGFAFLIIGILFLLVLLIRKGSAAKYTVAVVTAGTVVYQLWFYAMVYGCSLQRFMTMGLVIIWGMWIMRAQGAGRGKYHPGEAVFCLFAVLVLLHTVSDMRADLDGPFSNGREAAKYIRQNLESDAVYVVDAQAECSSIYPYLAKGTFVYAPTGQSYTYVTMDEHWTDRMDFDDFLEWLGEYDSQGKPVYFISSAVTNYIEGEDEAERPFSLLYESAEPSVKKEDFRIYKVR